MSSEHKDDEAGEYENAVLDNTGTIGTAGIGNLGTAQVRVTLPTADDDDADLVDDEPSAPRSPADEARPAPALYRTVASVTPAAPEPATPPTAAAVVPASTAEQVPERVRPRTSEVPLQSRRLGELGAGRETSDLLTSDRLVDPARVAQPAPEGVWQRFVYGVSGHLVNLGDSKGARERKELDRRIAQPLHGGAKFVPVLSRKGGVGKTTITTLLGMALADTRDDRIIAIDANPDRGTLAERVGQTGGKTVRDVVRTREEIRGFNDLSDIVARDETRLDVLASDTDPHVSEAFSDEDYRQVADLAAHYYSVILTDTGTGIVHSVMDATLAAADHLVVVTGLSVDEARLASETLTWLESNGYADLVRNTVVVLNAARPGAELVRGDELETHFGTRVRAVVRIPYDPQIATGSAVSFRDLRPATRAAARELAATVVEGLRSSNTAA
ncbi:MinD/ParA family ATP-binding protein [Microbacterium sp.]|uniref:MinD/ParA family ATP-binding protein n=1 Tax=Microbacterium sp. TaxID=51671 RepID=UPI003A8621A4